jgi:CBS domain-containing protein
MAMEKHKVKKEAPSFHPPISREVLSRFKVEDIMNRDPAVLTPEAPIETMVNLLRGQVVGCFPVVDKKQRLIGIVTESDALHVLHVPGGYRPVIGGTGVRALRKQMGTKVGDIMTKRPISARPKMSIGELLDVMDAHKLRHLPVVKDGDKLVGSVSLRDILNIHVVR